MILLRNAFPILLVLLTIVFAGCATDKSKDMEDLLLSTTAIGLVCASPTEIVFIPEILPIDFETSDIPSLSSIDVITGRISPILNHRGGFSFAASDVRNQRAFLGYKTTKVLGYSVLYLYTAGSEELVALPMPEVDAEDIYAASGVLPSETGRYVAYSLINYEVASKDRTPDGEMEEKHSPRYATIGGVVVLLDMDSKRVKRLEVEGWPLLWSTDENVLYCINSNGIVAVDTATLERKILTGASDIIWAFRSEALNSIIGVSGGDDILNLNILDEDFRVVRQICQLTQATYKQSESPAGKYFATLNDDGSYGVVNLITGAYTELVKSKLKSDHKQVPGFLDSAVIESLGPAWLDEESIVIGDVWGDIKILDPSGKVKKTIQAPGWKNVPELPGVALP